MHSFLVVKRLLRIIQETKERGPREGGTVVEVKIVVEPKILQEVVEEDSRHSPEM